MIQILKSALLNNKNKGSRASQLTTKISHCSKKVDTLTIIMIIYNYDYDNFGELAFPPRMTGFLSTMEMPLAARSLVKLKLSHLGGFATSQ